MAAVEVDFKYYLNNAVIPFLLILYLGAYMQLKRLLGGLTGLKKRLSKQATWQC